MKQVYERFLEYVTVHTASSDTGTTVPSTPCQFTLTHMLAEEMRGLGMTDVYEDEHAYVYGKIPATPGLENLPAVGFIAHLDTIPDFPGENVKPRVIPDYDGGDVVLGDSGRVLSPAVQTHLPGLKGRTLIVTDGTTVLGADDKAGIAAIMTAAERLMEEGKPHGPISICFTPDEEIGHGASLLDLERFGAAYAYTVDGGVPESLSFETFNAAKADWTVHGVNVHPGSAKDKMINASLVAMEINAMLPAGDIPSRTEEYEGFFHMMEMHGNIEKAELHYIIRDHDRSLFEGRKAAMKLIEKQINEKYGQGTAELVMKDQYYNMAELFPGHEEILDRARAAIRRAGLEPKHRAVRGGTDGSQLSFRGLLCPNLGTGGYAGHGPYEHTTFEGLQESCSITYYTMLGENA